MKMGQENHSNNTSAMLLVKALKNFIIPIINTQRAGKQDLIDMNNIHMPPEAQAFIDALENFVAAIVHPQLSERNTTNESETSDSTPMTSAEIHEHISAPVSEDNTSEKSTLLMLALEGARQRVFNIMPIRLMAFQEDGSGIELVERNMLWQRISVTLEAKFDEQDIRSKIQDTMANSNITEEKAEEKTIKEFISQHTQYAILSHTWLHNSPGEVTYANWKSGDFELSSTGYQKLASFCRIAATNHGINLGWMDTICINKESSSELDESIRSMYKWYNDAAICIAYLAQTSALSDMRCDPWFTRGWTLQELLAPSIIKFYSTSWKELAHGWNDRAMGSIQEEITAATTITGYEWVTFQPMGHRPYWPLIPISRRMQWAANRHVTREEDVAYSLMGIFGVSLSIAYGEGSERAFVRLVKEILSSSNRDVLDVINWGSGPSLLPSTDEHPSCLIPSSLKQYLWCTKKPFDWPKLVAPITLTHLGLHLPALLMPAIGVYPVDASLPSFTPIGNFYATVEVGMEDVFAGGIFRQTFNVLDKCISNQGDQGRTNIILAVLNFTEYETTIELPSILGCFAVAVWFPAIFTHKLGRVAKWRTEEPIVFDLQSLQPTSDRRIPKKDLAQHGIELRTLYL